MIIKPRVTEKAGVAHESSNIYTFEVSSTATKQSIAKMIKNLYKVTPLKIRTINLPSVKKALVYLKKGDTINIA